MSSQQTNAVGDALQRPITQDADYGQTSHEAPEPESASSRAEIPFDVFRKLVESPDDFLGLLAYSLYKRHKIEWIEAHPDDDHEAFKKVACTPQQLGMYRYQAEQMAKSFIDVSLDQLEAEMRSSILEGELITKIQDLDSSLHTKVTTMETAVTTKVEGLKPTFWGAFGNHLLGGFASVIAALLVFGGVTLYNLSQQNGGVEGVVRDASTKISERVTAPQVPTAQASQN